MVVGPRSQCGACKHMRPFDDKHPTSWGACFPDGIPDAVYGNELDHRQPIAGDHGVQFKAKAGDEFPVYAFRAAPIT